MAKSYVDCSKRKTKHASIYLMYLEGMRDGLKNVE